MSTVGSGITTVHGRQGSWERELDTKWGGNKGKLSAVSPTTSSVNEAAGPAAEAGVFSTEMCACIHTRGTWRGLRRRQRKRRPNRPWRPDMKDTVHELHSAWCPKSARRAWKPTAPFKTLHISLMAKPNQEPRKGAAWERDSGNYHFSSAKQEQYKVTKKGNLKTPDQCKSGRYSKTEGTPESINSLWSALLHLGSYTIFCQMSWVEKVIYLSDVVFNVLSQPGSSIIKV